MTEIDWDEPPDGETTEEMLRVAAQERTQREREERWNRVLWDKYRDFYGRDGELVIKPPRR